jgi:CDP-glucose 4,6-dehydratase
MSDLHFDKNFWTGKKVFLTGHTGFKGGWLSIWLDYLGAVVTGYSLDPITKPSIFEVAKVADSMASKIADIRNLEDLRLAICNAKPEIIFHLAAQPLVRHSYEFPIETYSTNVMGTANLLEVARTCNSVRSILAVTTDKVYKNQEWIWPYRENDQLGGHDPYSNSKACSELVIQSYTDSYFKKIAISSARAGNVIGGGDWSDDRLLPDLMRAFIFSQQLNIRNPDSIRPWQHVMEPLWGYLKLAQAGYEFGPSFSGAWNFGPAEAQLFSVKEVAELAVNLWGKKTEMVFGKKDIIKHEAKKLRLDSSKASLELGWQSILSAEDSIRLTVEWVKRFQSGEDAKKIVLSQIEAYQALIQVN